MIKNAVTLEALHTHTHTHTHTIPLLTRKEVHLLFKRISYLFKISSKGGFNLGGGLIE